MVLGDAEASRRELTAAIAGLVSVTASPAFLRQMTSQATTRSDDAALRTLWVISFTGIRRPGALAAESGLSRPQISKALDRLEMDGLIVRHRTAGDGRGVEIEVTRDGREVLKAISDVSNRFCSQVVSDWTSHDIALLTSLVTRFVRDSRQVAAADRAL